MAKVQIKAMDTFTHGRIRAAKGDKFTVSQHDATELSKVGLVEIIGDAADDDIDDLVGGKMEPITSNKMAPKPDNKAAKK